MTADVRAVMQPPGAEAPATTIPTRIRAAARAHPEAVAIVAPTGSVTYAELLACVDRADVLLAEHGLSPERPLAVLAEKTTETIAATLAAMERGIPVLLLSPMFPEHTRAEVLAESGARHLMHEFTLTTCDVAAPVPPDCALMLTTSGSSGTPKVVRLPAEAVARFVEWAQERFDLGPGRPTLSLAPLNFDLSLLDVWASLACGGSTVLVSETASLRGGHVLELLRTHRVHLAQGVPMFFHQMVSAPGRDPVPTLRHVILTGDRVNQEVLDGVLERFPKAAVHNVYGATETNDSFCHTVARLGQPPTVPLPIGRPLPGVTALVVDDDLVALTGPGSGELVVSTPFQAVGYTDDIDTRRRFIRLPGDVARVYYRSGDRATRGADGVFHYDGRGDRKVKVRGVLVDLDEIETVLREHEDVADVAVLASDDPVAGHRVHAVVSVEASAPGLRIALRLRCFETLHRGAVPSEIHIVEGPLPRTTTGKIDRRRALRDVTSTERQTA